MKNYISVLNKKIKLLPFNTKQKGFSLFEVLIALAIAAILAAIAVPSFLETIRRYRVVSARDGLVASINFARVEAIRNGAQVVVERSPASIACSVAPAVASDWGCGWTVYVDRNFNLTQDLPAEPSIQNISEPKGVAVTHPGNAGAVRLVVNRWGQPGTVGDRFTFFPSDQGIGAASTTSTCINAGGRIRNLPGTPVCTNT